MRIIAILVLVFGVALAGGALFFASEYFKGINALNAQQQTNATVRVLAAREPLSYGATISPGNLKWVEWPKSVVPSGAYTSAEDLMGEKGEQKRIVLRSIEPGELILESKITKFGESPRMSMNLGAGMRAVSISIDAVSGVAGFVSTGDRVDILLTRTQQGQLTSSVILQDITIIAVDQQSNAEGSAPRLGRTVTVEVDTTQAQKLAVARQVGKLSLTLRGLGEPIDEATLKPVTADALSDFQAAEKAQEFTVRVRRGAVLSDVKIGEPTPPAAEPEGETPAGN
jgi:pilus assembly protein CpaB